MFRLQVPPAVFYDPVFARVCVTIYLTISDHPICRQPLGDACFGDMGDDTQSRIDEIEAKERLLTELIERIYREEAEATHDEITIALNRLVESKSRELAERNRELESANQALNHAHAELLQAQKLESIGRLASGIAHEINTPIQFVGDSVHFIAEGVSDLLCLISQIEKEARSQCPQLLIAIDQFKRTLDFNYLAEQMPKAIERSAEGLSRVNQIVRSMKTFSYPDQRFMGPCNINDSIRTTLDISRNEYKHIAEIQTEFGDLPAIECLSGEINQVLLNLILNAAHAIEDAISCTGEIGTIMVRTWQESDSVIIEIEDTGCGIPDEIQSRVFDPFFTTKEVGRGTGQGLSIARQVITNRHRGDLTFTTTPGQGTTFRVRLPIRQMTQAA